LPPLGDISDLAQPFPPDPLHLLQFAQPNHEIGIQLAFQPDAFVLGVEGSQVGGEFGAVHQPWDLELDEWFQTHRPISEVVLRLPASFREGERSSSPAGVSGGGAPGRSPADEVPGRSYEQKAKNPANPKFVKNVSRPQRPGGGLAGRGA